MWMALLGCAEDLRTRDWPPGPGRAEDTAPRPAADTDTDADADSDVDADTDTDTGPASTRTVCWLGPAEDYTACAPVVDYDAGAFGSAYDYPAPYGGSPQYAAPARYVDLLALDDPSMAVAPNFDLDEYTVASKGQWGVLQGHHVEELQALRDAIGGPLTITSGYRSPEYNAGVGGVEYSRHMYGDASDLEASGWSVEALGDLCDAYAASYVGLYEDGHTHCDWRDEPLDPAFYDVSSARSTAPAPAESARIAADGDGLVAPATGFDEGEPLRRWTAYDAADHPLSTALGRRFVPPPGAARVTVVVGGRLAVDWPRPAEL